MAEANGTNNIACVFDRVTNQAAPLGSGVRTDLLKHLLGVEWNTWSGPCLAFLCSTLARPWIIQHSPWLLPLPSSVWILCFQCVPWSRIIFPVLPHQEVNSSVKGGKPVWLRHHLCFSEGEFPWYLVNQVWWRIGNVLKILPFSLILAFEDWDMESLRPSLSPLHPCNAQRFRNDDS